MSDEKAKQGDFDGSETIAVDGCIIKACIFMVLFLSLPLILAGGSSPNGIYFGSSPYNNLKRVYESLQIYARENKGEYPVDNWFVTLCPSGDFEEYNLSKYNGVVLNLHALELGEDSPDDMVLGFGSRDEDWGKAGVYDSNKFGERRYYMHCLFSDGIIRRVSNSHIRYLRWTKDGFDRPKLDTAGLYTVFGEIGLVTLATVVLCFRYFLKSFHVVVLVVALAYIPSFLFGSHGARLYLPLLDYTYHDSFRCIYWLGPVAAVGYVPLMKWLRARYRYFNDTSPVVFCGIITGLICAVLTHVILRYLYMEESINPMLGGIPFGLWSGAVLGWITSVLMGKNTKDQT